MVDGWGWRIWSEFIDLSLGGLGGLGGIGGDIYFSEFRTSRSEVRTSRSEPGSEMGLIIPRRFGAGVRDGANNTSEARSQGP